VPPPVGGSGVVCAGSGLYTIVQLLLEEFKYFSQVILKYTIGVDCFTATDKK